MAKIKRYTLKVNSVEKIEELLQELYDEVCNNINEISVQINKLTNSVQLNDELMESKVKYSKAINDFMTNKDKAIGRKIEIAKIMNDIIKNNGKVDEDKFNESMDIMDWDSLKEGISDKIAANVKTYSL